MYQISATQLLLTLAKGLSFPDPFWAPEELRAPEEHLSASQRHSHLFTYQTSFKHQELWVAVINNDNHTNCSNTQACCIFRTFSFLYWCFFPSFLLRVLHFSPTNCSGFLSFLVCICHDLTLQYRTWTKVAICISGKTQECFVFYVPKIFWLTSWIIKCLIYLFSLLLTSKEIQILIFRILLHPFINSLPSSSIHPWSYQ